MKILHQQGMSIVHLEEKSIPVPQAGEVLIQTAVSALCGSEMPTVRSSDGLPFGNLGHEAAGVVVDFGPGAQSTINPVTGERLKVGDRVGVSAIAGWPGDNSAVPDPHYLAGRYTWCERFTFHSNMHAEYFTIPAQACHVLPPDLSWDIGVLITGDGFGVPYHTSKKLNQIAPLSDKYITVAVLGLGPIGLGNLIMQKSLGRQVIGIDRVPKRLELAESLGADHVIESSSSEDIIQKINSITHCSGVDIAIEAAGLPITAHLAFKLVRKGGTVVFNGEQPTIELSPSEDFIRRDITAVGSWFYHFNEFQEMLSQARNGLPVASLITHRFPLEESDQAYNAMLNGLSGKVILTYSSLEKK